MDWIPFSWAGSLLDTGGAAAGPGHHPLQDGAGAAVDLGDIQLFGIHFEIVFRIGGAALQQLHQRLAGGLAGVHQDGGGGGHVLAADQVADDLDLTGGDTDVSQISLSFHNTLQPPYLDFAWPRKVRVGANSPSL